MHIAAQHFVGRVTQHGGARAIHKNAATTQVDSINALTRGVQQKFKLLPPSCVMRKSRKMFEHLMHQNVKLHDRCSNISATEFQN
jgi:transcription antitermination factor NusA-like protein